ncbi:uncharacterized protein E0L32_005702 [Thyridium curvatum]|uniref:MSP domain-containing protein n=1 Tax=Thyridium curvatum TaxID=1093900 RepID=A0A507AVK4_9PEZI|nr:uncharacterized protein E0L32_005702 [Thyridium curvatum]TPX14002.1 hypothetical protein E0L32_005702 [Thyridium curvatum]
MSVEIDPQELGFRRPFTVEVSQILRIKNPNTTPVAFKVKTTAPKQYCVRPNSGRIEPGRDVEVTGMICPVVSELRTVAQAVANGPPVLLQAMKQDPALDVKCRDKFLVQSVPITGDKEFVSIQEIWDGVAKSDVQEKKIRVVFLPADGKPGATLGTPAKQSQTNGVEATPEPPSHTFASPREGDAADNAPRLSDDSLASPETDRKVKPESETGSSVLAGTAPIVKETYEELKQQLARAKDEIAALTASAGLRQRKTTSTQESGEKAATSQPQLQQAVRQGTEGVPVQMVAMLCLLSFLLAYFFF